MSSGHPIGRRTLGATVLSLTLALLPWWSVSAQSKVAIATFSVPVKQTLGGEKVVATVVLSEPAPDGGLVLRVASSAAAGEVPKGGLVTVPAKVTTHSFVVLTRAVAKETEVRITAGSDGGEMAVVFNVVPPVLASVGVTPTVVVGGGAVTGKVTLSGNAPAGGFTVPLSSRLAAVSLSTSSGSGSTFTKASVVSEPPVVLPPSVTVAEGQRSQTFPITSSPVPVSSSPIIIAGHETLQKTATLTVQAPVVSSVSVQPQRVAGGGSATATVTLSGAAPPQGFTAVLTSGGAPGVTIPPSVSIAAGQRTATFPVTTAGVIDEVRAVIGVVPAISQQATLTVTPPEIAAVNLNSTRVPGGNTVNGTVSIGTPAPAGGLTVLVEKKPCAGSSSTLSTIGAVSDGTSNTITIGESGRSAVIPEGQSIGAFQVATERVDSEACFNVIAYRSGGTIDGPGAKSTTLTVHPPRPTAIVVQFPDLANATEGIGRIAGAVDFDGRWKTSPNPVTVRCEPARLLESTIQVPVTNGLTNSRGTFFTSTLPVGNDTTVTCSVTSAGVTKTTSFKILGPKVTAVELSAQRTRGGSVVTGTVSIDRAAPPGGLVVAMTSSNPSVATLGNVTVPSGQRLGALQFTTGAVTADSIVNISAVLNGATKVATVTVTP